MIEEYYWYIEHQIQLTGTWIISSAGLYPTREDAEHAIKIIKTGDTIYRTDIKYRVNNK